MAFGVIFAMLLIPLSQVFIQARTTDASTCQAISVVLKQAEIWLLLGAGSYFSSAWALPSPCPQPSACCAIPEGEGKSACVL